MKKNNPNLIVYYVACARNLKLIAPGSLMNQNLANQ
jgi:hypothetical protein